jgi:4-amino-4-deoxy-L-arabinose transferase-like glycosyltransferase
MIPTTFFDRRLRLLLLLDAALLLCILPCSALSRIDETQIAEVSREMAESRDLVTPRIGGTAFPAYPPLQYWVLTLFGTVFGFNEFSMRLPTALAALGLVWVIARLVRRLAGDDAGLAAGMILATTGAFFMQSIVCRADVITMFFATLGFDRFLAWTLPAEQGGRRNRDLGWMYGCTALGILTKGPLAVAMLGLGGLSWFLVNRQWKLLLAMKFWAGIPIVLLIVVPWYCAMYRVNGPGFLRENLLLENLNAYSEGYQQKRPWTFYLKQTFNLLPWLLALPLAASVRRSPGVAMSILWFALVVLFFQITSSKRVNYMAYWGPPLAAAAGTTLTAVWAGNPALFRRCMIGLGLTVAVVGVTLACIPPSSWTGSSIIKIAGLVPFLGAAIAAVAVSVTAVSVRFGGCAGFGAVTSALGGGFLIYGVWANARMNPEYREMAEFCRLVGRRVPPTEPLYVPGAGAEGFWHWYVGRTMPTRQGDPGLYLASKEQHEGLKTDGRKVEVLEQSAPDHRGRTRFLLRIHP